MLFCDVLSTTEKAQCEFKDICFHRLIFKLIVYCLDEQREQTHTSTQAINGPAVQTLRNYCTDSLLSSSAPFTCENIIDSGFLYFR